MRMLSSRQRLHRGFSLTEMLIAVSMTLLIILAISSVEITSRKFLYTAKRTSRIQDEVKIAMDHIAKRAQVGFAITVVSSSQIRIDLDDDGDGRFTGVPPDITVQYTYNPATNNIVYNYGAGTEDITDQIISNCDFSLGADNELMVTIEARFDPAQAEGPDNPQTTLTSTVIARAMSLN